MLFPKSLWFVPFPVNQLAFFRLYDVAYRAIKAVLPRARVMAPSLADGGPGLYGFQESVFPYLQAFLKHAATAGTLPDVVTWHVSMLGANASLLAEDHATLHDWASTQGITLPPLGHNEIMGPSEELAPAANLGFLATLDRLGADHSCKACYLIVPGGPSPCFDNSLDGLLTDNCNATLPNGTLPPGCAGLQPRGAYHVYAWFARLVAANATRVAWGPLSGTTCQRNLDGVAVRLGERSGPYEVLLGAWGDLAHPHLANETRVDLVLSGLPAAEYRVQCWRVAYVDQGRPAVTPLLVANETHQLPGRVAISPLGLHEAWRVRVEVLSGATTLEQMDAGALR